MIRDIPFSPGEWYHCYSRGVDKRKIFLTKGDYERFQMLLYACNSKTPIHISALDQNRIQGPTLNTVLEQERGEPLVEIGAYTLMPTHYHLLLRECTEGGLTLFMRKLGTGYTMFFNLKNERTGALFSGRFKARHVTYDDYFRRVLNYIHGNVAELYEPGWKEGKIHSVHALRAKALSYPYSSLQDYEGSRREAAAIINMSAVLDTLEEPPTFDRLISNQRDFHAKEEPETEERNIIGFD